MKELKLFIPITKVDEPKRLVYGIATAEQPDQSGEICDYESTVPYYKEWSARIEKASDGKSKGNLRSMHSSIAAGKITQISFNDEAKQIEICGKVVDDAEWKKVIEGVYTGFSQGGSYIKTWKDGDYTKYTANPAEVSLVDNPCLESATFAVLRTSGATEMRKFQIKEEPMLKKAKLAQVWQADDGSTYATKADALKKNADIEAAVASAPGDNALAAMEQILNKKEGKDDDKKGDNEKDGDADAGESEDEKDSGEEGQKDADDKDNKAEKAIKLKKGMFEVSRLADLLQELAWLQECCENEAMWEMDGSKLPAELMESVRSLGETLKAMATEEINELIGEEGQEMAMSAKIQEICKRGAKISAATKRHIDSMHKSAEDHMAHMTKCYKAMGMEGNGETGNEEEVKKSAASEFEKQELIKAKEESDAKNVALKEQIDKQNEALTKFADRLKRVENQPLPTKGALYAVDKAHEHRPDSGSDRNAAESKPIRSRSRGISPEEARRRIYGN